MSLNIIQTEMAPRAIGPYSQGVQAGEFVFCSGQIPIDPTTNELKLFDGDVRAQTELVMSNISAMASACGVKVDRVVKSTIFLTSMDDFQTVNEVYSKYFTANPPARSTVEVSRLPKGVKVEIEVVIYKG